MPRPGGAGDGAGVTLITGGFDKPYAYGLAKALAQQGLAVEVIGSDVLDSPEMRAIPGATFLCCQTMPRPSWPAWRKLASVLAYYARLACHLSRSRPRIVHILWNNKLAYLDRTVMMAALRLSGKRAVLTAHNVNTRKRDNRDSVWNRWTLRLQYRLANRIFVHSRRAAQELQEDFGVPARRTTIIPFGVNDSIPRSGIDSRTAKRTLGLRDGERAILFYGGIRPYKGLHYLVEAFEFLTAEDTAPYRLIVAGQPKKEDAAYWRELSGRIARSPAADRISLRIEFIPDAETECYFMAADVLALPYTQVYQSGVLFLGYNYGLPVVATRAGSMEDEIEPGETGYLCEPADARSLVAALQRYFGSDLYNELPARRERIREYGQAHHSWEIVGQRTADVYRELLQ